MKLILRLPATLEILPSTFQSSPADKQTQICHNLSTLYNTLPQLGKLRGQATAMILKHFVIAPSSPFTSHWRDLCTSLSRDDCLSLTSVITSSLQSQYRARAWHQHLIFTSSLTTRTVEHIHGVPKKGGIVYCLVNNFFSFFTFQLSFYQ